MPERIFKVVKILGETDAGVPPFGKPGVTLPLLTEGELIINNTGEELLKHSLLRIKSFEDSNPNVHVVFPFSAHFQHHGFPSETWLEYGNMQAEYNRTSFMLNNYESRTFPVGFTKIVDKANKTNNPIRTWYLQKNEIARIANHVQMSTKNKLVPEKFDLDLAAKPVYYETSPDLAREEAKLWESSCIKLAVELNNGEKRSILPFLHLYAHIKDPVSPILVGLNEKTDSFELLLSYLNDVNISKYTVAQLACEVNNLYFAQQKDEMKAIYYGNQHQFLYLQLTPESLPKGELTNPKRVKDVMFDIVEKSKEIDEPMLTPITIAHIYDPRKGFKKFIVDGNNRVVSLLCLKFLENGNYKIPDNLSINVDLFAKQIGLSKKWETDLCAVLKHLNKADIDRLKENSDIIKRIVDCKMPAMLVDEPNFHTINVESSKSDEIKLIQPVNQLLFNTGDVSIAPKQQSHGRPMDNAVLVTMESRFEKNR